MAYDITGTEKYKLLPNILRRVKLRSGMRSGSFLFDNYDVKDGERPEDVAYKWFGDAEYHWVILMTNNITDRYFGWPLGQLDFEKMLKDKYGGSGDGIHHYEIVQTSGPATSTDYSHLVQCNSTEPGALPVSNREYEQRIQDEKRRIKLLEPNLLTPFVQEFERIVNEPSVA